MPLAKEIEFPLFHLGHARSSNGTLVKFTPEKLRELERNSNFVLRAGVLHPPIKYDHPAFGAPDKENHGKLAGYELRGNSLIAKGTNWSDRLVADKAREAIISYSGEFVEEFEYPDPVTGKMVKLGPTVVGLAMLGSQRPAVKNLKPVSQFEFGEEISVVDAYETREELRKSGLVAEYVEGTHFFGEVENDASRFREQETHMPLTAEDLSSIGNVVSTKIAESEARIDAKIGAVKTEIKTETDTKLTAMSEAGQRVAGIKAFSEAAKKEKPFLRALGQICTANFDAMMLAPSDATVKAFVESIPTVMVPLGRSDANKGENAGGGGGDNEPKALADLRPKHFKDPRNHETEIAAGVQAFSEFKPDEVKGLEAKPDLLIEKTKRYIMERDGATN